MSADRTEGPTITDDCDGAAEFRARAKEEFRRAANLLSAWGLSASMHGERATAEAMRRQERRFLHLGGLCGCTSQKPFAECVAALPELRAKRAGCER